MNMEKHCVQALMISSRRFGRLLVVALFTFPSMYVIFVPTRTLPDSHREQIDSINPMFAPATGMSETGGTSLFSHFYQDNDIVGTHRSIRIF